MPQFSVLAFLDHRAYHSACVNCTGTTCQPLCLSCLKGFSLTLVLYEWILTQLKVWKYFRQRNFGYIHVVRQEGGDDASEVCASGQIARFMKFIGGQPGPAPIDFAPRHVTAQKPHYITVPVVGSRVTIFFGRAAEFGHDGNCRVLVHGAQSLD